MQQHIKSLAKLRLDRFRFSPVIHNFIATNWSVSYRINKYRLILAKIPIRQKYSTKEMADGCEKSTCKRKTLISNDKNN